MNDYTKARPIEKGCLAMIISKKMPYLTGTIVKVLNKRDYFEKPAWNVAFEHGWWFEWALIRVDDPDTQKQIEAEMKKPKSKTRA